MQGPAELRLHVNLWLDPNVHARSATRQWFEDAWQSVGGVLRDELATHPLVEDDIRRPLLAGRIQQTLPPIGSPYCYLTNFGGDCGNEVTAAHTMNPRGWSWFLNELQEGDGGGAHLAGGFIEQRTHAPCGLWLGWPDLAVRAATIGPIIAQVRMGLSADPEFLAGTVEQEQAICAFLYQAAAAADPTYGEISLQPSTQMPGEALLNGALNTLSLRDKQRNWRVHPRDQLKGYSWVTVVPGDVLERLGGSDAVRATGAFHAVELLPAGGVWLQATERLADYNLAAARKVFEALRPVLVKGRPTLPEGMQLMLVDQAA